MRAWMSYGVLSRMGKALLAILCLSAPASAEDVTLLALGDSLTQGYGLVEEDGLVPQMESWLSDNGAEVRVINAGVSGDTTAGGAARVDWSLTPEVDAMMVILGGNDMLRGIDPQISRSNLARVLESAQTKDIPVLLVGMRAPGNYGPDYAAAFDAIYPDLAEQYSTLLHPYFFSGLGEGTPETLLGYFQPDGIHPNADGVARIVKGLGPSVLRLIDLAK